MGWRPFSFLLMIIAALVFAAPAYTAPGDTSEETQGIDRPMTAERLDKLIRAVGQEVDQRGPAVWTFKVDGAGVTVVADEGADRMRILTAIGKVKDFPKGLYHRINASELR